jgi:hypothetical protein
VSPSLGLGGRPAWPDTDENATSSSATQQATSSAATVLPTTSSAPTSAVAVAPVSVPASVTTQAPHRA